MHLKYPRKKTKFALKLASVFHRAVLTNGHVPRVPGFFLNGVVPCTDHCANYIGTCTVVPYMRDRQEREGNAWDGRRISDGQEKEGEMGSNAAMNTCKSKYTQMCR